MSVYDKIITITQDTDLINSWMKLLENYEYIEETDDPEIGIYARYIDLREYPPVLKTGGIITDYDDMTVKFKIGYPAPRFWTVKREFVAIFQKVSFRMNLIRLAEKTVIEKLGPAK